MFSALNPFAIESGVGPVLGPDPVDIGRRTWSQPIITTTTPVVHVVLAGVIGKACRLGSRMGGKVGNFILTETMGARVIDQSVVHITGHPLVHIEFAGLELRI